SCRCCGCGRPLRRASSSLELLQTPAQIFDLGERFREPIEMAELAQVFAVCPSRRAPVGLLRSDLAAWQDPGLPAEDDLAPDMGLVTNADLTRHRDIVLDDDAARKAGLRGDDDMLPEAAIVSDVDEVV